MDFRNEALNGQRMQQVGARAAARSGCIFALVHSECCSTSVQAHFSPSLVPCTGRMVPCTGCMVPCTGCMSRCIGCTSIGKPAVGMLILDCTHLFAACCHYSILLPLGYILKPPLFDPVDMSQANAHQRQAHQQAVGGRWCSRLQLHALCCCTAADG